MRGELSRQLLGRRAHGGVSAHAARGELREAHGDVPAELVERRRSDAPAGAPAVAAEGPEAAAEHVVQEEPDRVDVRAEVVGLSLEALRRDVGGRAGDGLSIHLGSADDAREAEVQNLHDHAPAVAREEHVRRLDIPMHHVPAMGLGEGQADLASDARRLTDGQRFPARQDLRQVLPAQELHRHEGDPLAGRARLEHGGDVGMSELGEVRVARAPRRFAVLALSLGDAEQFEGDVAVRAPIDRLVHDSVSALTDAVQHLEPSAEAAPW